MLVKESIKKGWCYLYMRAVIMAGGEGTRLRPLTCNLPKPMARLCGKPIVEYILDLLNEHQISDATFALGYLPQVITDHFEAGQYKTVKLSFVEEDKPLGTAGGVRGALKSLDEDVLVISGDAMCDFDLSRAIRFHREKKADVTILTKRVEDPREYGLVDVDKEGRIVGFIEKPSYSQAVTDFANTGIYILSPSCLAMIPEGAKYDFSSDLFPKMLKNRMRLFACEDTGYWCDIGDLGSYIGCAKDILYGRVKCETIGRRDEDGNIFGDNVRVDTDFMTPPVYLGSNVSIGRDCVIDAGCMIDDGTDIERQVRLSGCMALQNCFIEKEASLKDCILCEGVSVKSKAMLFENAVIGTKTVIGRNVHVNPGVKVWPFKNVRDGELLNANLKDASRKTEYFDDDGISGDTGVELTPELFAKIGRAAGSVCTTAIGVGISDEMNGAALKDALISGILSTGVNAYDFKECFESQFGFCVDKMNLKLGIFIEYGEKSSIHLCVENGLSSTREIERKMENILARSEFKRCRYDEFGKRTDMSGMKHLYTVYLESMIRRPYDGFGVLLISPDNNPSRLFKRVLEHRKCRIDDKGLQISFEDSGRRLRLYHGQTGYVSYEKALALCALIEFKQEHDVYLPSDAPYIIDELAQCYSRRVYRYLECPAGGCDSEIRRKAAAQPWARDALIMAVKILNYMQLERIGFKQLMDGLPNFDMVCRQVPCEGNPGNILKQLKSTEEPGMVSEGVVIPFQNGYIFVKPSKQGHTLKLFAQAKNYESAREICDGLEQKIKRLKETRK